MKLIETRIMLGIMAVVITQSTRVIRAQRFKFLSRVRWGNMENWHVRLGKCIVGYRLQARELKTVIGGMPNKFTQSATRCLICRLRSSWSCLERLVLRFLLLGFAPLSGCFCNRSGLLLSLWCVSARICLRLRKAKLKATSNQAQPRS